VVSAERGRPAAFDIAQGGLLLGSQRMEPPQRRAVFADDVRDVEALAVRAR